MSALVKNNSEWYDTNGRLISAHGGGITRVSNTFYWYGASYARNPQGFFGKKIKYTPDPDTWERYFDGFNVYSSQDLVNWSYEGKALSAPKKGWCRLYGSHRPHVVYNEETLKFVMFFYYYPVYPGCMLMVAYSDAPTGPFKIKAFIETGSASGHTGDMNVFKDKNGKAYIVYDDCSFNILIDRLTDDYYSSLKDGVLVMERKQEAPAMIRYQEKYFVTASGVKEWNPTETTLVFAERPLGPYSQKQIISQNNTWNSQITDLIHIPQCDSVMAMCDQWFVPDSNDINQSRYLWLPLRFEKGGTTVRMHYLDIWDPLQPV